MDSDQKRAFSAVVLSGVVLVLWQLYFAPKDVFQEEAPVANKVAQTTSNQEVNKQERVVEEVIEPKSVKTPLRDIILQNENYKYSFKSDFSVRNIESKDAVFPFSEITESKIPFQVFIKDAGVAKAINFNIKEEKNNSVMAFNDKYKIGLALALQENGKLSINITSTTPYQYRFVFKSTPKSLENSQIRKFITFSSDVDSSDVGSQEAGEGKLTWFGLDFNYHLFSFVFLGKTPTKYWMTESGQMMVETISPSTQISGGLVFLKKNFDQLAALGNNLDKAVDLGIFGIIAVPILRMLQFFYKYFPNYGVAIILLTIVIRLLLYPLQHKSFKSMKKMQKIQPEIQKLREKFKDDPQRMQKETMALFKKVGANPLGGCLPLLAQMPVFFAFYRVLYSAVELVEAPFIGWIHDLSIKDPFYVLPVLMTIAMFAQTKLNPTTTTDPTQQKVMLFMPLIFGFIMKDLPAGLNLYILVSTVLGISLQLLTYRSIKD